MAKSTISITFKLDGDAKGFSELSRSADGLKAAMTGAIQESTKMKDSLAQWSLSVQGIEATSNAVGQLNDVFQDVISSSKDFDTAMRQTNTMAGKGAKEFEGLKDSVSEVAKEVPVARDLLAKGLYQVISNGVPEDNWISFLEKSARSSVGGIADLEKVVTVTSTVIKNYGMAWSDAQAVQDKIQLTAKNGVTSFEQLAEALPRVTGAAANLGVGIDELMAVFATATGVTGNTSEVSTQLAAILSAITKQSSGAAKMAEEMGIQFDAAAVKSAGGLRNFLVQLDVAITEYASKTGQLKETIYANLFGSAESLRLLTSLTGQQSDIFGRNIDAMKDSVGTMDAAFREASNTDEAFGQMLKNNTAALSDFVAGIAGGAAPLLDFGANAGMTMMSVAMLSKTLKANGLVMRLNSSLTKAATGILHRFSMTTHKTGIAVRATSRSIKVMKFAIAGLTGAGILVALDALAMAFAGISDKADEAKEKEKELAEENKRWRDSLMDLGDAVTSGTGKEIAALNILYNTAKDETKSREERKRAIIEMQNLYPDYFSNIDSERINIQDLQGGYEKLKDSIIDAARARAIRKKIEENAGAELDLEMEGDKLLKEEETRQKAYEKAKQQTIKNIKERRDMEEDMGWFARSGYAAEPTSGRIGDQEVASSIKAEREAEEQLNATKEKRIENEKRLKIVREANLELENKLGNKAVKTKNAATTANASTEVEENKIVKESEMDLVSVLQMKTGTLEEIGNKLSELRKLQKTATEENISAINKEIEVLEERKDKMLGMGIEKKPQQHKEVEAEVKFVENLYAQTLAEIGYNIEGLQGKLQNATAAEAVAINQSIQMWRKKADAIRNAGLETRNMAQDMMQGWNAIKGIGSSIDSITDAIEGTGNAWKKIVAIVDGVIGLYQGFTVVSGIISTLTGLSQGHTTVKAAEGVAEEGAAAATTAAAAENVISAGSQVAANKAAAASFTQLAAAQYMAAHASIPFVGYSIGAGYVAAMETLVAAAGLPMLAEGGIASGPTLAMVGEYGGASSNPEVIAPLDKLKKMIGRDNDGGVSGKVEFKIEGRDLVGVLNREINVRKRG